MTKFYETIHSAIRMQGKAIPETLRSVNLEGIDSLQDKRVIFTGCGDSFAVANFGMWIFRRIGHDASVFSPSELSMLPIDEKSVVVGITASGRSLETIEGLRYAHTHNAHTVVLTDNKEGKANDYANQIWLTKAGASTYNTSPSSPTTCAMAYLLKMGAHLSGSSSEALRDDVKRLERDLDDIIRWAESDGKKIAAILKTRELAYLISEGPNFVAAQVGMMKLNEYSIVRGVSVLREEFRHHCNLSVRKGDPAVFITDSPPQMKDSRYLKVLSEVLKLRSFHLYCPEVLQIVTPYGQAIANTISLQFGAYWHALKHSPNKTGFKMPNAEAFRIY